MDTKKYNDSGLELDFHKYDGHKVSDKELKKVNNEIN